MTVETVSANGAATDTTKSESEGITQYTDGYAYEVPRPFLTLQQAATILGKSIRTIERSLTGRWGAKLPEGWVARKLRTEQGDEWRILPPPGFRVKLATPPSLSDGTADGGSTECDTEFVFTESYEMSVSDFTPSHTPSAPRGRRVARQQTIDSPAIVIDRSEEVESLLRELVSTQRALSEERRLHMEDLRMIHQLQGSMRLLEANANETSKLKQELEMAKNELSEWKERMKRELSAPWWRRLFRNQL